MNDWPTILYFGNDWNGENKTSSRHIAQRLIRDHYVVYIECPGLRAPKGTKRDINRIFSKLGKVLQGLRSIDGRSYVYTLFQIPFHRFAFVRWLNRHLVIWSLRFLCRRLNIERPILWFVLPHLAMVLGKLNESFKVYYCIDDYSSLPDVNKEIIAAMDKQMTKECDLVFVSAQPLFESKKPYSDKVKLSRHGVDFEHFNQVYTKQARAAEYVNALPHPVVGFFGLIENWVDLEIIRYAAQQRPEWSFLMIGRVAVENNPCKDMHNVHFIGARKYDDLPKYAQVFDVATIPCIDNELIYNFNPLKLREYLAMGKPVVSTYYPEVEPFMDVVEVGRTKEQFLEKLEKAIKTDNLEISKRRVEKVRHLSWENRYSEVIQTVNEYFRRKNRS